MFNDIMRYFLISGLEYFSMLCLIYGFFRLKPWSYLKEIIITAIVLNISTIVDIYIIKTELYYSTTFIVFGIVAISFYLVFRKFNYMLLSIIGIGLYLSIQGFIIGLFTLSNQLTTDELFIINEQGELVQIITSLISLLIILILKIENGGFSYSLKGSITKILGLIVASIFPVLSISVVHYNFDIGKQNLFTFAPMLFIGIIAIILIVIFSNYSERKEYGL